MSTTNPTDVLTEWDELQIKYGNYEAPPKTITNEELTAISIDFAEMQDPLANKSLKQLEKLEDAHPDEVLQKYRNQRLAELKELKKAEKFGEVYDIIRSNYIDEITEASKKEELIILYLYSMSKLCCKLLDQAFIKMARNHKYAKICRAVGTDVIENIPESRLPTVVIYQNGKCCQQILGTTIWGGPNKITYNNVEWVLWKLGYLKFSFLRDDPRPENCPEVKSPKKRIHKSVFAALSSDEESDDKSDTEATRGYSSIAMEKALSLDKSF